MTTKEVESSSTQPHQQPKVQPHKQEDNLRRLYLQEGYTQEEIGDKYDIDQSTVSYWMGKYDIQKEEPDVYRNEVTNGKIQYVIPEEDCTFYEHDLIAALDPNIHTADIFWNGERPGEDDGYDDPVIHHRMACPYAIDIEDNLEVMEKREHTESHKSGVAADNPFEVLDSIFRDLGSGKIDISAGISAARRRMWHNRLTVETDSGETTQEVQSQ